MRTILLIAASFLIINLAWAQNQPEVRSAPLIGADGKPTGLVTFTEAPHGVLVRIEASGITPGWHAAHFHEKGECSAVQKFVDAGGHIHSGKHAIHGLLNRDANDVGDLPNVYAAADGTINAQLYSTLVALNPGTHRPALLGKQGSALMIHASQDDYTSQPIGGAGARIACAVIR